MTWDWLPPSVLGRGELLESDFGDFRVLNHRRWYVEKKFLSPQRVMNRIRDFFFCWRINELVNLYAKIITFGKF